MASKSDSEDRALRLSERVLRSGTPYNTTVHQIIAKSIKREIARKQYDRKHLTEQQYLHGFVESEISKIEHAIANPRAQPSSNPNKHHLMELFREEFFDYNRECTKEEMLSFKGDTYTILENGRHDNLTVSILIKRVTSKNMILHVTEEYDCVFHRFATSEESEEQIVVRDTRRDTATYKISVGHTNPQQRMLRQMDKLIARYQIHSDMAIIDAWEDLI